MRAVRRTAAALASAVVLAPPCPSPLNAQSAQGRTGTLVVLNKEAATATFVDVATGERVTTLPTGEGPHELAMTGDGRWAVSTDYAGGNSLTVLDVAGLRVVGTVDLGASPRPHGAVFLPGDSILAVTSEASRSVLLAQPFRAAVLGRIGTDAQGSHMVAATGDGRTLYTGDIGSATVSRLGVASRTKTASYDVPAQPEAITVTRDGTQVWVGSNAEGVVSVVDPRTGSVETALSGFSWPYRILILEKRRMVVIPDLGAHVVRFIDLDTRGEIDRIELPDEGPQGVTSTPDEGTLFLSLSRSGQVAVIDVDSRRVVRRLAAGPGPDGIGWSPLVLRR